MICEWCGHDHARTALCTKRPTWGRRGFLALVGSAIVGAAIPVPLHQLEQVTVPITWETRGATFITPMWVTREVARIMVNEIRLTKVYAVTFYERALLQEYPSRREKEVRGKR